jgi:Flp pilus assembly protein TadB
MGVTAAVAAVVGAGYAVHSGEQAKNRQEDQAAAQKRANAKAEKQADQAMNRANQRTPDASTLLAEAQNRGLNSGTMLTGAQGIDPSALTLGKNTLLGS